MEIDDPKSKNSDQIIPKFSTNDNFSLLVLQLLKSAQMHHGLRHGDYTRYRNDLTALPEAGINTVKPSDTYRQSDAMTVQRAFSVSDKSELSNSKGQSYISEVIKASPSLTRSVSLPTVPQLQSSQRALPLRIAAMFNVLVPTVLNKQGAQLLAVAFLVLSRTWISDRIASLNARQYQYLIGRLRKAVKWGYLFSNLCAIKGGSRTNLEAEVIELGMNFLTVDDMSALLAIKLRKKLRFNRHAC